MTAGSPALARRVRAACHLTGEFRLRSGQTSHEYFDKYRFEADPSLLDAVAGGLAELLPGCVDAVAGLELGGVPLATALSLRTGLPTRFVRKRAKEYGTRRLAEGGEVDGLRLAVIEDVVTTGGQLLESCAALRAAGAEPAVVLCVIDRQAGGAKALANVGLELRALLTAEQLANAAG